MDEFTLRVREVLMQARRLALSGIDKQPMPIIRRQLVLLPAVAESSAAGEYTVIHDWHHCTYRYSGRGSGVYGPVLVRRIPATLEACGKSWAETCIGSTVPTGRLLERRAVECDHYDRLLWVGDMTHERFRRWCRDVWRHPDRAESGTIVRDGAT